MPPDVSAATATTDQLAPADTAPSLGEASSAVATEQTLAPDFEADSDLHFEDEDSPLKLIDYSAPFSEDLLPLASASASPIIAAPPPEAPAAETPSLEDTPPEKPKSPKVKAPKVETPAVEMPTLTTPSFDTAAAAAPEATGDFTSTLRMSRDELAAAVAAPPVSGVPPVAPFVLDAPLVLPANEQTPPRLVVRMGRMSAAFDIAKAVTVIGRPDSEMHYYPDVEIDLDDAVSRRHAEIIHRDDSYFLTDTGSTNGTLLNGEKLPSHEERLLTHGDRIRVGERTEIIFE